MRSQACREFINRNKATGGATTKSPELVAKHVDGLLKKSNKAGEEADLEAALKNTVSLRIGLVVPATSAASFFPVNFHRLCMPLFRVLQIRR